MALQAKVIKSKISAIKNIRKITRAMEMVAATKMRKAVNAVVDSKEYVKRAYELLINLGKSTELDHPLLGIKDAGDKVLLIAISSNRGLCGAYNTNIRKLVAKYVKDNPANYDYITVGKHIERTVKKLDGDMLASFTNISDAISPEDMWGVSQLAIDQYLTGNYSKVLLFYTRFDSTLSYTPMTKNILPIRQKDLDKTMDDMEIPEEERAVESFNDSYYEPGAEEVLDFVLPRVIEVYIYQAMLEALASEHSSRMIAMKNASDNAKKFIESLTVGYNRARQAGITQEIAEIAAGSIITS